MTPTIIEMVAEFQGVRPRRVQVSESGQVLIGGEPMREHRIKAFVEWARREYPRAFPADDPIEIEIRSRCQEIQREWSPQERRAREIGHTMAAKSGERSITRREPWRPPLVTSYADAG